MDDATMKETLEDFAGAVILSGVVFVLLWVMVHFFKVVT